MNRRRIIRARTYAGPLVLSSAPAPDPLLAMSDTFDSGASDPASRSPAWGEYKPAAFGGSVTGGYLDLAMVTGGGNDYLTLPDADASHWFSPSNTHQRDGYLIYRSVGPASGTSVSFDARARLSARDLLWSANPTATGGVWSFAPLAVHSADRSSYLRYLHVAVGADPTTVGVEVKVNRVNASGGASVYPVVPHGGGPLDVDVRIVRRSTDTDLFDVYWRLSSGDLSDDSGWTLAHTVRWSNGAAGDDTFPACPQETDSAMPDDVQVGVTSYSNATVPDFSARCHEFWIGPTTA